MRAKRPETLPERSPELAPASKHHNPKEAVAFIWTVVQDERCGESVLYNEHPVPRNPAEVTLHGSSQVSALTLGALAAARSQAAKKWNCESVACFIHPEVQALPKARAPTSCNMMMPTM